ncbi:MAG: hypothetical protein ACKOPE_03415 [Novosphingobium sp.]
MRFKIDAAMRSRAILLAGAASLLPVTAGMALADLPQQAPLARFAPPNGPLVLTRTLYRSLADGKEVVVTRRFAIRITPEADGYRIDGEQIDASVVAPPMLSALAELERKRIESGIFPARLNQQGLILGAAPRTDPAPREAAIRLASTMIEGARMPDPDKRARDTGLRQVSGAYSETAWPEFLFNPGLGERRDARRIALPGGAEGEVEVRVEVQGLMDGGLPRRLERTVTTRLSGTNRVLREVWTIAPADPIR